MSDETEPIGYEVLIFTNGSWSADWDGVLHPTLAEGRAAEAEAKAAGWPHQLATLIGTPKDAR